MNENPITSMENSEVKCNSSWQFEFKCGEEKLEKKPIEMSQRNSLMLTIY